MLFFSNILKYCYSIFDFYFCFEKTDDEKVCVFFKNPSTIFLFLKWKKENAILSIGISTKYLTFDRFAHNLKLTFHFVPMFFFVWSVILVENKSHLIAIFE